MRQLYGDGLGVATPACRVRLGRAVACVLLLLCGGMVGVAQPAQVDVESAATINYTDAGFGFELELPAGWEYDRTRFQQFEGSIGLLRGRGPQARRSLQITVFRSFDMQPFEDWVLSFGKALGEAGNARKVNWETIQLPPRAGAILSYAARVGADAWQSHNLCVPFDPNTVWVFSYSGGAANEAEQGLIRREFDRIIGSLRVHYDPAEIERLAPAFDRGKALIARLHKNAERVRLDENKYYYELVIAGKGVGYMTRRITREEYVFSKPGAKRRYSKDGIRVRERSWTFADDGSARYTRLDLFSSFDMRSEIIENQSTQIPPADDEGVKVFVKTDQVLREDQVLFSSQTSSLDRTLPDPNKPIGVGPVYLDLAWVRLLPGVLLNKPGELYALAMYDSETRALLSHRIKLLGECAVPGFEGSAFEFEVRDGFVGPQNRIVCDRSGSLLRLESGDLLVRRITRDQAENKYGRKRDEARKRGGMIGD